MSVVNELWYYRYVSREAVQEIYSKFGVAFVDL